LDEEAIALAADEYGNDGSAGPRARAQSSMRRPR